MRRPDSPSAAQREGDALSVARAQHAQPSAASSRPQQSCGTPAAFWRSCRKLRGIKRNEKVSGATLTTELFVKSLKTCQNIMSTCLLESIRLFHNPAVILRAIKQPVCDLKCRLSDSVCWLLVYVCAKWVARVAARREPAQSRSTCEQQEKSAAPTSAGAVKSL